MHLILSRDDAKPDRTIGRLYVTPECWTLEDEVRDGPKVPGKTAIPAGRYRVKMTQSVRFQRRLPEVLDVPGFSGVRIHVGNTAADTAGCILVGTDRSDSVILHSRVAVERLCGKLNDAEARGEEIWLTVF